MRETEIITKEVTKEETIDIICNACGESCAAHTSSSFEHNIYTGLIEHVVRGGYFSKFLEDQTEYTFSLCEQCLMGLFKTFKIPAHIVDYSI